MSSTDLRAFLLLLAAGAALSACATPKASDGTALVAPTQQYKPKVEEAPETLALAPHAAGLSEPQRSALSAFALKYQEDQPGEVTLRVPQGGDDAVTPTRMAAQVMQALEAQGVPRARVRVAGYDGKADAAAPVVLSYWRFKAERVDCADTWNNIAATGSNKVTGNFGCSTTANFAAMVADPRDILRPAAEDPADNSRRAVVMQAYRKGENTSTQVDQQASGAVSKAVP